MNKLLLVLIFFFFSQRVFSHINRDYTKELMVEVASGDNSKIEIRDFFPKEKIKLVSQALHIYLIQFKDSIPWSKIEELKRLHVIVSYSKNAPLQVRSTTPNDSFFKYQFQHSNYIRSNAKIPVGIRSVDAWDYLNNGLTKNNDTIVVVIADQGFDSLHEDLDYFINYNEIPNDSIDNDKNGAIDDYRGWNVALNNHKIDFDYTGHGVNAAGIAAAKGNNKKGVAGVAWNVKIMPLADLRLIDDAITMFDYCYQMKKKYWETNKKQGAYIVAVNFSLGTLGAKPTDFPLWCAAIQKLNEVGIIVSVAAANSYGNAYNIGDMPVLCNCSNMINVTTFDSSSFKVTNWSYSDSFIHLAAPSKGYTTFPNNSYGTAPSGTSHATPLVAGAIGLMYNQFTNTFLDSIRKNPSGILRLIKSTLIESSDFDSSLIGKVYKGKKLTIFKAVKLSSTLIDSIKPRDTNDTTHHSSINNIHSINSIYAFENHLYINKLPKAQIQIYNLMGQMILNKKIELQEEIIDVSLWPKGLYLTLITSNQEIYHYKFIKE